MTFEQWWEKKEEALKRGIFAGTDDAFLAAAMRKQLDSMRAEFADCWNQALSSAEVQMERIERQIREPQIPPVNDLETWILFYRSRFNRALQLIKVRKAGA